MEVAPFFVDFHHFLSIFTIFYRFSRFTHFCRDLHFVAIYALFPQIYFGQNSLPRNITRFLHVCISCCPLRARLITRDLEGQRKMINHWSVLSVRRPSKPHGAAPPNPIALCLETPAPPLQTPSRCASKPQVRRASKPLGTKFETKIFKFRWFLGPSDQNELYHTPLLSKIWDLGDRNFFGGGSLYQP